MSEWLEKINEPNDIKNIPVEKLPELAKEIRKLILQVTSTNGGHLAPSLGTVELTMALHYCMEFPKDRLIWDVGHQAYTHKILTGRRSSFSTLRTEGGISGFPKRSESDCDAFDVGHSSTSVSVAAGMVKARELRGSKERIVAVIGDGSLSGGLAYEGLNNIGRVHSNVVIILNDNEMSIAKNVGGMANYLGKVRMSRNYIDFKGNLEHALGRSQIGEKIVHTLKKTKDSIKQMIIPGEFFNELGLQYFGPIDGHNLSELIHAYQVAEQINGPVLLHVVTQKGKGYRFAEEDPSRFHGIDPFCLTTGASLAGKKPETFTGCFSKSLVELGQAHPDVIAITAAMPAGTGLTAFQKAFPDRFVDVGIAEEHAVTFAGGLAVSGMRPVVAVYSTFLQRAYDQIIHDVAMCSLPVIFALDRAGIVGNDGETHQGVFDLAFLSHIPNLVVMAPANGLELGKMLSFAYELACPVAIRYPRGSYGCEQAVLAGNEPLAVGRFEALCHGTDIGLVFLGPFEQLAFDVKDALAEQGKKLSIWNGRFAAPLDEETIRELARTHRVLITIEEGIKTGGFGERIAAFVQEEGLDLKVLVIALPNRFLPQAEQNKIRQDCGFTKAAILEKLSGLIES